MSSSRIKILLSAAAIVFVGAQVAASALVMYLQHDWDSFKARANKIEVVVTESSQSTETRRATNKKGHIREETRTVYHVRLKSAELNREFILPSGKPAVVGQSIVGYFDANNTNELRVEGLNQNIPPSFAVHIMAFFFCAFFLVPMGFFFALPALLEATNAKARVRSPSDVDINRKTG